MANDTLNFKYDRSVGRDIDASNDCFIRALAISLDVPWSEVIELVNSYLEYALCERDAGYHGTPCYIARLVLSGLGFRQVECVHGSTLENWLDFGNLPSNCVVLLKNHALAVRDNRAHDMSFTSHSIVHEYWVN